MNRTPLAEQKHQQQRRSRRKRSLRDSHSKISMSKLNQENYDSNVHESQSSILSVSMRKGRRIPKSKSPIPRQSETAKKRLQEQIEAERLQMEQEEAERLKREQEELELEMQRKREEMLVNCEKARERIESFLILKKLNLMTASFNSVKCSANKIKIQESFADELCTLNLKRSFLLSLKEATKKSQYRFKLVRNFARILRLNMRERIRAQQIGIFQRIKRIRPKPFHRTNNRVRKRKISKNTKADLEKEKSNRAKEKAREKAKQSRLERLEKMKNSALNPQKPAPQPRMKRSKTAKGAKNNTTARRVSKSPNVPSEMNKTSRNMRSRRNTRKSRKLDKKSKSTLELNKVNKSSIDLKSSQNRESMLEKNIVFDNSKLSKSHVKNFNNSKSSQNLGRGVNKTDIKLKNGKHARRRSKKIPKLEGFGSVTKAKKKDRSYINEINTKNGDESGKNFDLFEQSNDTKDSNLDIFVVSKVKKEPVDQAERSFRRHRNREMCGDEIESISVDLRKPQKITL